MGAIYRVTCKANGKVYIGQTTKTGWRQRYDYEMTRIAWKARSGKQLRPFEKAAVKHGWGIFEFRDLMTNVPDGMLDALERFFIRNHRAAERAFGYNCEGGGNAKKTLSADVKKKISEANRVVLAWKHATHGEFIGGCRDLVRAFPEQGLTVCGAEHLSRGETRSHKGWVCPLAPVKARSKRVVRVWAHAIHGEVIASAGGLARAFPQHSIRPQELSYVANPNYAWSKSHRGWTYVREATSDEERECCMRGAA